MCYETARPEVSTTDDEAVMSALYEKDITLEGEISRMLDLKNITLGKVGM